MFSDRYSGVLARSVLGALLLVGGCGTRATRATAPVEPAAPVEKIGECLELEAGGRISQKPDIEQSARDLNRDGREEIVIRDKKLCRGGNCYWNLFAWDGSCHRYLGTVAGAAIETGELGDQGYPDLRSWWQFSGGDRALLHAYRFGGRGYLLVETLICRSRYDDGIECALEESL